MGWISSVLLVAAIATGTSRMANRSTPSRSAARGGGGRFPHGNCRLCGHGSTAGVPDHDYFFRRHGLRLYDDASRNGSLRAVGGPVRAAERKIPPADRTGDFGRQAC